MKERPSVDPRREPGISGDARSGVPGGRNSSLGRARNLETEGEDPGRTLLREEDFLSELPQSSSPRKRWKAGLGRKGLARCPFPPGVGGDGVGDRNESTGGLRLPVDCLRETTNEREVGDLVR